MRVGFVSYWFERGQAYVTKNVMQAIEDDCEMFVFARSDGVNAIGSDGEWDIPNLTKHEQYHIPQETLRNWVLGNDLDLVFFNEEYDFNLVGMVQAMGVATMGIYYWELFDPRYAEPCNIVYDVIICPTQACFQRFGELGVKNIHHVKWGVDLDVFKPIERESNEVVRFFHPAGWGGMHNRRGTEYVIDAYRAMDNENAELLIHSQKILTRETHDIGLVCGTVSRSELISLYQESDVVILPSMWEGLGLTFLEAIGCGLPIITVDAPPMNEFVYDRDTGYCVEAYASTDYPDIFVPAELVDVNSMSEKMDMLTDRDLLSAMRETTITIRLKWDWKVNSQPLRDLILELGENAVGKKGKGGKAELDAITDLIQAECYPDKFSGADTREYARFHKILADPMVRGRVLDVGCKHGTLAFMLGQRENLSVYGMDADENNIKIAQSLMSEREGHVIQFTHNAIKDMPYREESFSTIILSQVLEHIHDPEDLQILMKTLTPDGCLIITTNVGFAHWDPDHKWFFWPDRTYDMLKGGWSFMEQNGDPAFLKQKGSVPFGAFIEKYLGEAYGYQVYNNHDSQHHSLEIYARVYKDEATLMPFPEIAGDEIIMEDYSSVTMQTAQATISIGDFTILRNREDRISNYIRNGKFEEWMQPLIDAYADKNKIAIDMGSNIGVHSAYMSMKFAHVLAFEPQKVIADMSKQTFINNGFKNITVINAACSDDNDVIDFPVIDYRKTKNCGSVSAVREERDNVSGWDGESYTSVDAILVDEIFGQLFPDSEVGFIKIDVEGYELKALKGAEEILQRFRCPVVVELKDRPPGNVQRVNSFFTTIGYNHCRVVGEQNWDYLYEAHPVP